MSEECSNTDSNIFWKSEPPFQCQILGGAHFSVHAMPSIASISHFMTDFSNMSSRVKLLLSAAMLPSAFIPASSQFLKLQLAIAAGAVEGKLCATAADACRCTAAQLICALRSAVSDSAFPLTVEILVLLELTVKPTPEQFCLQAALMLADVVDLTSPKRRRQARWHWLFCVCEKFIRVMYRLEDANTNNPTPAQDAGDVLCIWCRHVGVCVCNYNPA